jgi:hypothetical protein
MSIVETSSNNDHITIETNNDHKKPQSDINNKNTIDDEKLPAQKSTISALVDEKPDPHAAGT